MFAVLHIADFALHAVLRTEPADSGRPAVLLDGARKKALVLAATAAARAAGVECGMTAPQALARCAALAIHTPRPAAEAEARAALLAVGFTLSPTIEDTAPGVCTIDLKGADAVRPGRREPIREAVAGLARLGLPACAGIAPTPLLALYAARAAPDRNRPAAENPPADPVLIVADAADFLGPLPLAAIDPAPELAAILAGWGLRTVGDLARLARDDLGRRLGPAGLDLWDRAAGGAPRPLHPVTPAPTFDAAMEFEHEVETLEPLLFVLRRLVDRLALDLQARARVAAELTLTLTLADERRHVRSFRLPEPSARPEHLFGVLHTHLESLHTEAAIGRVALDITPTRPLVRQPGLFEAGLRDPHGFAQTLAHLGAIVGGDRVGTPQLEDTHRPDAVKLTPPAAVAPPAGPPPVWAPLGLPLRRFRPPLPARLELTAGRPTYLWTERFHSAIAAVRGPWRGSGDWWQSDRAWQRIEYDIALAGGGLYRLLLTGGAWFVEGEYD